MTETSASIVILFPEYLGDFIMLIPFIYGLKQVFPLSTIDIYTSPVASKCAEHHPCVDNVMIIPKLRKSGRVQWKEVYKFSNELKQKKYNYGYFTNDYMFWPLFFGGIGTIIQEQKSLLFRLTCKGTPQKFRRDNLRHAAQRHVNNLEHAFSVSIPVDSYNFGLNFPDSLIASSFIPKAPYIYLNADGNSVKKYTPSFYQDLCRWLLDQNYSVLIDGIKDQFGLSQFSEHPNVVYTVGKTSLYELFGLIKQSSLVISVDSGPSHLACVFKKKSVIFHPPKANFPFKTAGFYKDNWSYKQSPSESQCQLNCSVFQACKETYCDSDYNLDDVKRLIDHVWKTERTWDEKAVEMLQKSVGIGFLVQKELSEEQRQWVSMMKQKGFFIIVQDRVNTRLLSLDWMHQFIKTHRLHIVVSDSKRLPVKLVVWDLWYRFSERAYVKFLPRPNYTDDTWFDSAISKLKK